MRGNIWNRNIPKQIYPNTRQEDSMTLNHYRNEAAEFLKGLAWNMKNAALK